MVINYECIVINYECIVINYECIVINYECTVINYDKCKYKNPASNSTNIVTSKAERRMVYSLYTKKQIIYYYEQGYRAPSIESLLLDEDIVASRLGIAKLLRRYEEIRTIVKTPEFRQAYSDNSRN